MSLLKLFLSWCTNLLGFVQLKEDDSSIDFKTVNEKKEWELLKVKNNYLVREEVDNKDFIYFKKSTLDEFVKTKLI